MRLRRICASAFLLLIAAVVLAVVAIPGQVPFDRNVWRDSVTARYSMKDDLLLLLKKGTWTRDDVRETLGKPLIGSLVSFCCGEDF